MEIPFNKEIINKEFLGKVLPQTKEQTSEEKYIELKKTINQKMKKSGQHEPSDYATKITIEKYLKITQGKL